MFLLFAYDDYYPSGGWEDFRGKFDTLEEAKAAVSKNLKPPSVWVSDRSFDYKIGDYSYDNYHIVDLSTLTTVDSN